MLFPIDRVFETEKAFVFVLHDDCADRYYLRRREKDATTRELAAHTRRAMVDPLGFEPACM
jgi:hypothetical protein